MNSVADLGPARLGERLTGRSPHHEIDPGAADERGDPVDLGHAGQIPIDAQTREVVTVGLERLTVVVGRQNDVEACLLQAEAEPSGATKKVSGQPGSRVASPDLRCKL